MPDSSLPSIARLVEIMKRLRDPETGCPWDRAQNFSTIAPYTIEEAYEVEDAIATGSVDEICDELGDLLFQVVFYARMAEEREWFAFDDIARAVADKLIRRHPHVFSDGAIVSAEEQTRNWEQIKQSERAERQPEASALDGVPPNLPGLTRAAKLQRRAALVGFDWPDWAGPLSKIREETDELQVELHRESAVPERLEAELGDLLFSCVNLARHLGIDPEAAVRASNRRFGARFRAMEQSAGSKGRAMEELSADELEGLWTRAKQHVK